MLGETSSILMMHKVLPRERIKARQQLPRRGSTDVLHQDLVKCFLFVAYDGHADFRIKTIPQKVHVKT